jgi:hypothetical protein
MPFFTPSEYAAPDRFAYGAPTQKDFSVGAQAVVHQDRGLLTTLGGDIGLGAVDLVDSAASSIPGINHFFARGDVNSAALSAMDMPGLNDFYHDNEGGINVASGVMGVVASELIARKITAPAGVFMGALRTLPYARRLATLDAEYTSAMQTVRNVDTALAARGAMGIEQYVGKAVVDDTIFSAAANDFVTTSREISRSRSVFRAKGLGALKGAQHAAATESVMALTLNQNGFLYDDDAGHNLAWMGMGLGLAAGAEWLHGAYQIRKFVNSDSVRRVFSSALDPEGVEESRLLWHGRNVSPELKNMQTYLAGSVTDRITSLLVNASQLSETRVGQGADASLLLAQRESLATQHLKLAQEEAAKVTTKGISTNGYTRFGTNSAGYSNHVEMMMHRDAGSMYGVEMLGGVPEELSIHGINESHQARLDERIAQTESRLAEPDLDPDVADQLSSLRRRLQYEKTLTPMAIIDGERVPMSEAEAIEGFTEPQIRFNKDEPIAFGEPSNPTGSWETVSENPAGGVRLDSDLSIHLPSNRGLDTADHFDMLRLYRVAQRAVGDMAQWTKPIILPRKPTWFHLDLAEEILRRSEGRAQIQFPAGMTRESAQVESLTQKALALKKWNPANAKLAQQALKRGQTYEGQLSKLRVRYNLPKLTAYERGLLAESDHPVEALARSALDGRTPDELREMSLADVKDAVARIKRVGDIAPVTGNDIQSLSGNSFAYMLDESGRPIKPLIAYMRPFQSAEWAQDYLAERIAARKMTTVTRLVGDESAPMTRAISSSVVNSPDFDAAARTHELMDNQIQGGIIGAAPQSSAGAFGRALNTSDWRDRDNPILLAATRLREGINRMARDYMRQTIESSFGDSLSLLENPRNAASKLLLNQFHSFRSGWDLAPDVISRDGPRGDKLHAFTLSNTEGNQTRFKQVFGREMPIGQTLLSPDGKEVVLDELGLDLQNRFNQVTDALRGEKNTLLNANGMGQINRVNWFVPPPNTNGKFIGFVIGPDGKTVPGMTVVAETEGEFSKARDALNGKITELGAGYTFRTQDEIRDFASIWDRAQMDFIDPGTTAIQPNRVSRGALTGSQVKTDAFQESLQYLRAQFLRHSNDITETLLKDQINAAKARANIASDVSRNRANQYRDTKYRSIYDMYLENLTGKSKLASSGSLVGRLANPLEGTIDKALSEGTPHVSKVWLATTGWLSRTNPWGRTAAARKDFETLSAKLGEYMPFGSATEMLERRAAGATPLTVAKITGGLNRFSAAMLLRMLEVAHPIMNLTGMVNAIPSVIRNMSTREGETLEDFAARVGHSANIFHLGDGRAVGTLDMTKIGARAFKRAWSRASEPDYAYMVRNGFLSQEVAEFQRQFGTIDGPGPWKKFFFGDSKSKGLVGWLSIMSDRSEDFSRSWGHMAGLELADTLGITGMEARHAFAHDIANKMIANYSPANRPEIFQGALGAPLGLFQSFVINYWERLFRYVETKDWHALGTQYAMQGSLFGMTSLPGWSTFNAMFMHSTGGEQDPTSGIWNRFGESAGDLLGNGLISQIPKLFGAPGVDLYSRGDVNIRVPGVGGNSVPAFALLAKLKEGIQTGIQQFAASNGHLSTTQIGEIASNMVANRPLAGMIEQFLASGDHVDHFGQLVTETKGLAEATYRLIGLRSERQSKDINAFYANKNAQSLKSGQDEVLRLATRSSMRAGTFEEDMPRLWNQYLQNGGDPRYFRRWVKEQYTSATTTRSQRQLEAALKDPTKMTQVMRLLDAGVSINADEQTPDPSLTMDESAGSGEELNQDTLAPGNYAGQITTGESPQEP